MLGKKRRRVWNPRSQMKEVGDWSPVLIDLLNQFSINDHGGSSFHGVVGGEILFGIFDSRRREIEENNSIYHLKNFIEKGRR